MKQDITHLTGLLWHYSAPLTQTDLDHATARYTQRTGQPPSLLYLHPGQKPAQLPLTNLQLFEAGYILKNHFLLA